jgi:hypothetical protein
MRRVRETKSRLYSKERKKRRASGIIKEVSGQLKTMENKKAMQRKSRQHSMTATSTNGSGVGESVCVCQSHNHKVS